jgi:hypothetical protein
MYIQEGGVKLYAVNEVGKEAIVAILGPGGFVHAFKEYPSRGSPEPQLDQEVFVRCFSAF